jgi:hypothetical protein
MRSFLGFGQVTYIGQPYSQPVKLAGISGAEVPLLFQWISYGASSVNPNINVLVNLETSACKAIDQIRSIYIDNLGSSIPVYVYFPDTGETLSAKANSEGWYPAFTNAKQFWVIGQGFLDGNIPQTYIIASNIPMQTSVNTELDQAIALWAASPVITRGSSIYNSKFGIPALGDQLQSVPFTPNVAGGTAPLWGTPYLSGFLYLTSLQINCFSVGPGGSGISFGQLSLESTGVAGVLVQPIWECIGQPSSFTSQGYIGGPILTISGQIKLDATQTWRLRVVTAAGNAGQGQVTSAFTVSP